MGVGTSTTSSTPGSAAIEIPTNDSTTSAPLSCPVSAKNTTGTQQNESTNSPPSSCPMRKFGNIGNTFGLGKPTYHPVTAGDKLESGCPSGDKKPYKNPDVFNVYNTKIDPTNQMPVYSNNTQKPAADQRIPLPQERVKSTIPKGGTDNDTWTYPSPQMFWNALVRKDKTEGVTEEDMTTVIAIHNNMNENTWAQVIEWENIHYDPTNMTPTELEANAGKEPKLLRFMGRPDQLTPKARFKTWFGHPAPFDRHDWFVDRGGKEVRYVIDYYHDESAVAADQTPRGLTDANSMKSIRVDVRPALDSIGAAIDRVIRMPLRQVTGNSKLDTPPFFAPKIMISAEKDKDSRLQANWTAIQEKCAPVRQTLVDCTSEESCRAASVALQLCTASIVCPSVAAEFEACSTALKQKNGSDSKKVSNSSSNSIPRNSNTEEAKMAAVGAAYTSMLQCLELFEIDSRKAMSDDK